MNSYIILFLFLFCACSSHSQDILYKKGEIKTISVNLRQDTILWNYNAMLGYKKFTNQNTFFEATNFDHKTWIMYDEKGNIKNMYGKKSLKNTFELPPVYPPVGCQIIQDTTYLLYPTKEIFVCLGDKILKKIKLQLPDDYIVTRDTPFEYIKSTNEFLISVSDTYKKPNIFFANSKPLSFFDKNGKRLRSMGEYPKEYSKDVYFNPGFFYFKTLVENDKIYIMYTMFPTIYEYNLQGKLLRSFGQKSDKMNYEIKYHKQTIDELDGKVAFNDYYAGFAKVYKKDIFYYVYFTHHQNKQGGQYYYAKYDIEKKIYIESVEKNKNIFSVFILPKADENNFYTLNVSPFDENIFINKCTITE